MDMQTAARLSEAAYTGSPVEGYEIDADLSNRNRTVYVDPNTHKAVIAFSGTRLGSKRDRMRDLGTDALLAMGLQGISSRFRNAKKVTRAAIHKYGKDNVSTTGHSLASSQGVYINAKMGVPHVGFSPGVSVKDAKSGLLTKLSNAVLMKGRKANNNATVYYVRGDPVSALAPTLDNAKVVRVKQSVAGDPHSLRNFME